jgi:hypothetical protein
MVRNDEASVRAFGTPKTDVASPLPVHLVSKALEGSNRL